jgi:hypothetical protein
MYTVWKDRCTVYAQQNCCDKGDVTDTGKQDPKTIFPLFIVGQYNNNMGRVDLVDQVTDTYPSMCKTIKLHKKLPSRV